VGGGGAACGWVAKKSKGLPLVVRLIAADAGGGSGLRKGGASGLSRYWDRSAGLSIASSKRSASIAGGGSKPAGAGGSVSAFGKAVPASTAAENGVSAGVPCTGCGSGPDTAGCDFSATGLDT